MGGEAANERANERFVRSLPPVVIGVPAVVSPATFARKWPPKHVPWTAPEHRAPVIPGHVVNYALLLDTKGNIAKVEPDSGELPSGVGLPAGARKMISALELRPGWRTIVTHARGWEVNGSGETAQSPIWEKTTTEEGSKRKQVGKRDRDPVDSILVRSFAENADGLVFFAGHWINSRWSKGHALVMPNIRLAEIGWQPMRETRQGARNARAVPTLSEWLVLAVDMDVKPEPPPWPPRKGMIH